LPDAQRIWSNAQIDQMRLTIIPHWKYLRLKSLVYGQV